MTSMFGSLTPGEAHALGDKLYSAWASYGYSPLAQEMDELMNQLEDETGITI
jgi:hypothetical protein